jgi:TonB-dependent starch-binding outer membrane protein SusC
MLTFGRTGIILGGMSLLAMAACGRSELPPAGPQPGEVEVGYGTQPADQVLGAVTSVSGAPAEDTQSARIEELLRGRVAGLQVVALPGGGYTFRIRGLNTTDPNPPEPLFIVDGVPVGIDGIEAALSGLTRNDIRQVDVLRDVASTSIYGTRGAGGVVMITTRRR